MKREVKRMPVVPNAFDSLIGRLVKVVYTDSGGEVKVKKGQLVSADLEFIQLKTYAHAYVIKRSAITELKTLGGGE